MKYAAAGCVLFALLLGGCEPPPLDDGQTALDIWAVGATNDAAIRNAIIRQSTLFPYQFEANGADLNNLGMRDLRVLATHFKAYPGNMNVRRGPESQELYDQRVKRVVACLDRAGVPSGRVSVKDLPAGGDGMPSELMILIVEADASGYSKPETGSDPTEKPTIQGGGEK